MLKFKILEKIESFAERAREESKSRAKHLQGVLPFGVQFLDDALCGILKNDLVLIGAKTGVGKTQLASLISFHNALMGKRVHYFALEAEEYEIERRMKYRLISEAIYGDPEIKLNYLDWYLGKFESQLHGIEKQIDERVQAFKSMYTFYKRGDFTVKDLERHVAAIQDETDLVVIDHIHYLDSLENEDDNSALKNIVKRTRDLALEVGKPVILLAQLRKSAVYQKQFVPDNEDFHGSSDITKIATKVITISPTNLERPERHLFPTAIAICKARVDGARSRWCAVHNYDVAMSGYRKEYFLSRIPFSEKPDFISSALNMPFWATHAEVHTPQVTHMEGWE